MFAGEKAARTTEAGLYLINDQQRAAFAAKCCYTSDILFISKMHATFALYQFNNHGCRLLINCCLQCWQIVIAYMGNARNERRKWLAVMRVPGSGECSHRTAMEAAQRGNDIGTTGCQACEFKSAFNGFGSAIAQEETRDACGRNLC